MLRRRTLLSLAITFALAVTACTVFYWKFVRPYIELISGGELPQELQAEGARVGAGLLTRTEFARTSPPGYFSLFFPTIGDAEDIAVGEFDGQPGPDVVVAGRYGAHIYDFAGTKRSDIPYRFDVKQLKLGPFTSESPKMMLGDMQVFDIDGDGTCEYVARGSLDGAAVFDHGGGLLWSYGEFDDEKTSIDGMAVSDLDGDGVAEFVTEWDKLELHDRHGGKLWEQPQKGVLHHMEVADADADGKPEILMGSGELAVADASGQTVREVELPFYLGRFSILSQPDGRARLLAVEDGQVWTFDSKGETVRPFAAPLAQLKVKPRQTILGETSEVSVYKGEGAWVRLAPAQPEALAVITSYVSENRSVLYVYDQSGGLIYMEVLPGECASIAALPAEEGRAQEFLVGCNEVVWRYLAKMS